MIRTVRRPRLTSIPALVATGLLLAGCPRPGLAPAEETDTTTTISETTTSETTTSGTTDTTGTTDATTTTTTTVEPVIFVTISNPGADIGSSVSVISDGRVLWAGVQSPTAGDVDGFVKLLAPDGTEVWSYEDEKGPGLQQVFQAVESGPSLFAAGAGLFPPGDSDLDGFTSRLSKGGIIEKKSVVSSPVIDGMTALAPAGDPMGGVFVAGTVGGTSAVPEGGGSTFGAPDDVFVMRIRQDGFVPWNMVCAGGTPASSPRALVRDAVNGRLVLGLIVRGPLAIPGEGGLEIAPIGADSSDGVVFLVDEATQPGTAVTKHLLFRSTGADTVEAIAMDDQGGFFVAGTYTGDELKLDGVVIASGNPDGQREAFVTRFDPAGAEMWTQRFGGAGNQRILALAFAGGSLHVAGALDDDGVLANDPVAHGGGVDLVVAKVDPGNGEVVSLRVSDGPGDEWPASLAVDGGGGVWLTGDFSGEMSFAGKQATANGAFDAFLVRLPP